MKHHKKVYTKTYLLLSRGFTVKEIKKKIYSYYGVSIKESDILKWFPIKQNYNAYSPIVKRMLISLYIKCSNPKKLIEYLSKYHNIHVNIQSLRDLTFRAGLKRRDKQINTFLKDFSMIPLDSPEKAYFLGLMMSDGSVHTNEKSVALLLSDEDAISFIAEYIGVGYKVRMPSGSKERRAHKKPTYRFELYSSILVKELSFYGVTPRKSLTLNPDLSPEDIPYLNYVLRGIIDGDGSIRPDGSRVSIYTASPNFAKWCVGAFVSLGFDPPKIRKRAPEKIGWAELYTVETASKKNMKLLREIIYNKPFGMMRKYNRLYDVKEKRSETIIKTVD